MYAQRHWNVGFGTELEDWSNLVVRRPSTLLELHVLCTCSDEAMMVLPIQVAGSEACTDAYKVQCKLRPSCKNARMAVDFSARVRGDRCSDPIHSCLKIKIDVLSY
jgi:hypothetical protein